MEGRLLGMQDSVGSTPIAGSEVNSLASRHSFVEATEEEAVINSRFDSGTSALVAFVWGRCPTPS